MKSYTAIMIDNLNIMRKQTGHLYISDQVTHTQSVDIPSSTRIREYQEEMTKKSLSIDSFLSNAYENCSLAIKLVDPNANMSNLMLIKYNALQFINTTMEHRQKQWSISVPDRFLTKNQHFEKRSIDPTRILDKIIHANPFNFTYTHKVTKHNFSHDFSNMSNDILSHENADTNSKILAYSEKYAMSAAKISMEIALLHEKFANSAQMTLNYWSNFLLDMDLKVVEITREIYSLMINKHLRHKMCSLSLGKNVIVQQALFIPQNNTIKCDVWTYEAAYNLFKIMNFPFQINGIPCLVTTQLFVLHLNKKDTFIDENMLNECVVTDKDYICHPATLLRENCGRSLKNNSLEGCNFLSNVHEWQVIQLSPGRLYFHVMTPRTLSAVYDNKISKFTIAKQGIIEFSGPYIRYLNKTFFNNSTGNTIAVHPIEPMEIDDSDFELSYLNLALAIIACILWIAPCCLGSYQMKEINPTLVKKKCSKIPAQKSTGKRPAQKEYIELEIKE